LHVGEVGQRYTPMSTHPYIHTHIYTSITYTPTELAPHRRFLRCVDNNSVPLDLRRLTLSYKAKSERIKKNKAEFLLEKFLRKQDLQQFRVRCIYVYMYICILYSIYVSVYVYVYVWGNSLKVTLESLKAREITLKTPKALEISLKTPKVLEITLKTPKTHKALEITLKSHKAP
jgi:hypothetical protein